MATTSPTPIQPHSPPHPPPAHQIDVCLYFIAAHRLKARGVLSGLWLWVLYVLLIVVAPVTVAALAGWGFVDNWLRSRPVARGA